MKAKGRIILAFMMIILAMLASCRSVAESEVDSSFMDFSSDALLLVETIEDVHPIFIIDGMLPGYYEEWRAIYLAETAYPMTLTDFGLATRRYLTVLRDGHTSVSTVLDGGFINMNFIAQDGRLFLAHTPDDEVLEIGGVAVADIFYQIDRHYFSESKAMRMMRYANLTSFESILRVAGAKIEDTS